MGQLLVKEGYTITADCRLDNRHELCEALGMSPADGDTVLLLHAYLRWGMDSPNHLLGDFAFAIWDESAGTLFCARDHFGIKPFYYYDSERYFVFASELSAIFASGLASRDIEEERIADFLAGNSSDSDRTSYRDIRRLPPGHACKVSKSGLNIAAYWSLPPPISQPRTDAPADFRQLLGQAVQSRMRGGPAGAMLSGGLDSSSIACMAAGLASAAPLPTFSIVFDGTPELNERPFIEAVLAKGGFDPYFIASDNVPPFAAVDNMLDEQQDLFLGVNMASSRQIYHAARRAGIKVLLDGHGGDEVAIVGAGRLHELAASGRWLKLWREIEGGLQEADESRFAVFWLLFSHYSAAKHIRRLIKSFRRRLGLANPVADSSANFINPAFTARIEAAIRRPRSVQPARTAFGESAWHHEVLTGPLQSHALEVLDRVAARAGVEARYPFWDKRLVEFCLSLEPHEKLNDGWGRLILRRGMAGILPEKIRWRRGKFDFKIHLAAALVRNHASLVKTVFADKGNSLGQYVALPALRAAFERLCRPEVPPDGHELQVIWRAVILAFWLERERAVDDTQDDKIGSVMATPANWCGKAAMDAT